MARLRVRHDEPGRASELPTTAVVGSMGIHMMLVGLVVWGGARIALPSPSRVYQVELIAASTAAPVRDLPAPETRRATPELETELQPVETKPVPTEKPRPVPEREAAEPGESDAEKEASDRPPASAPGVEEGDAEVPVRLEGARFAHPEYLENIIVQIKRHWRPPQEGQGLRAELAFTILRDGSVEDIAWIRRSGVPAFDLEARGAIESAGRRRAFGPLPEEYPADHLRVSFFFDPSRY